MRVTVDRHGYRARGTEAWPWTQRLRDIALRRKNFLFAGSHNATHRTAVLYSLLGTAAQHSVPPLPYLTDVLTKLAAGWDSDRLDELLHDRWRPPPTSEAPSAAPP